MSFLGFSVEEPSEVDLKKLSANNLSQPPNSLVDSEDELEEIEIALVDGPEIIEEVDEEMINEEDEEEEVCVEEEYEEVDDENDEIDDQMPDNLLNDANDQVGLLVNRMPNFVLISRRFGLCNASSTECFVSNVTNPIPDGP